MQARGNLHVKLLLQQFSYNNFWSIDNYICVNIYYEPSVVPNQKTYIEKAATRRTHASAKGAESKIQIMSKLRQKEIQFSKLKIKCVRVLECMKMHKNRFISPILRCPTSFSHSPISPCRRRNYFVKCNVNIRDYYCCSFSSNNFICFVYNPLGMNPGNFRCNIKWLILLVCAHTERLPALTLAEWRYPAFVCFRFVIAF